jgi:hypothetical protein
MDLGAVLFFPGLTTLPVPAGLLIGIRRTPCKGFYFVYYRISNPNYVEITIITYYRIRNICLRL